MWRRDFAPPGRGGPLALRRRWAHDGSIIREKVDDDLARELIGHQQARRLDRAVLAGNELDHLWSQVADVRDILACSDTHHDQHFHRQT